MPTVTAIPDAIAVVDVMSVAPARAVVDGVAYVEETLPFNEIPVPRVPAVCANFTFEIWLNVPVNATKLYFEKELSPAVTGFAARLADASSIDFQSQFETVVSVVDPDAPFLSYHVAVAAIFLSFHESYYVFIIPQFHEKHKNAVFAVYRTSDNIDYATIKCPFPSTTIITNYGDVTATRTITPTKNCFLIGKAVALSSGSAAEISYDGNIIAGIPHYYSGASDPNIQVGVCVLLRKNQAYKLRIDGNGRFELLKTVEIAWG